VFRLCELYPGIYLATEEKAQKNLRYGSRKVSRYPGGSSPVHIYIQKAHKIQNGTNITIKEIGEVRAVPRLCELYPGICLTTEEKARKTLRYGSREVPPYAGGSRYEYVYHTAQKKLETRQR
jgi:hypothetical protein